MRITHKYAVYPTKSQEGRMNNSMSILRHLANRAIAERIRVYKEFGISLSYIDQQNELPQLKAECPWYKAVYSLSLQDALRRVDKAFRKLFKKKGGFPKFKKHGQWNSITYPDHRAMPENGYVKVAKIGILKIRYHRDIPAGAKIKTLTVVKDGGKWFVCFSLDLEDFFPGCTELAKLAKVSCLGIDLGLGNFVFTSDNRKFGHPKFLQKELKKIRQLQRKLQRTKKKSPERKKVIGKISKLFYRIKCRRKDFFYKLARKLLSGCDVVVHEDLSIRNMLRRPKPKKDDSGEYLPNGACYKAGLNRSISDAAWGMFIQILSFVAQKLGKRVIAVPPKNTSQICSQCLTKVPKTLATRVHKCTSCGYKADRDLNAAKNILRLGLESLGSEISS